MLNKFKIILKLRKGIYVFFLFMLFSKISFSEEKNSKIVRTDRETLQKIEEMNENKNILFPAPRALITSFQLYALL